MKLRAFHFLLLAVLARESRAEWGDLEATVTGKTPCPRTETQWAERQRPLAIRLSTTAIDQSTVSRLRTCLEEAKELFARTPKLGACYSPIENFLRDLRDRSQSFTAIDGTDADYHEKAAPYVGVPDYLQTQSLLKALRRRN